MEMGGLDVGSGRPEQHRVMPQTGAPLEQTRMLSAPDPVSSITKSMMAVATEILEKYVRPPPMDDAMSAAIWEQFQQWRAATTQFIPAGMESSARVSAFDRLRHWVQTPRKDDEWEPRPEMTPRKIERGCQTSRAAGSEPPHSTSQKRRSQSQPQDEGEAKKGHTEIDGWSHRVQVGIDWSTTGIRKPVPKPDPRHPSFKPNLSGDNKDPQPQMKSAVVSKGSQKQGGSRSTTPRSQGQSMIKASKKTSGPTDPEKIELRDKPNLWIAT